MFSFAIPYPFFWKKFQGAVRISCCKKSLLFGNRDTKPIEIDLPEDHLFWKSYHTYIRLGGCGHREMLRSQYQLWTNRSPVFIDSPSQWFDNSVVSIIDTDASSSPPSSILPLCPPMLNIFPTIIPAPLSLPEKTVFIPWSNSAIIRKVYNYLKLFPNTWYHREYIRKATVLPGTRQEVKKALRGRHLQSIDSIGVVRQHHQLAFKTEISFS